MNKKRKKSGLGIYQKKKKKNLELRLWGKKKVPYGDWDLKKDYELDKNIKENLKFKL